MPQRPAHMRKTTTAARKAPAKTKVSAKTKAPRKSASVAGAPRKKAKQPAAVSGVLGVVQRALDDMKAVNVAVLDVRELTDITDTMIIASGTSDRHVRSLADRIVEYAKKAGYRPSGVEGERDGEWVLVDLQDVIVHVMLPRVREFYRLENLWDISTARRAAAANDGADVDTVD